MNWVNIIFVTIGANFTHIRSYIYLGQETYCLDFQVKRSKVKVTVGGGITIDSSPPSSIYMVGHNYRNPFNFLS